MTSQAIPFFIVIDDDPINNLICKKYIQMVFPNADIQTFTSPENGLEFILSNYSTPHPTESVLFLDINMPVMNGWDVLDRIITYSEGIKKQLKIFILSSSVASDDRQKANNSELVFGFIEKPLTIPQLQQMFSDPQALA